jgi:hypothetical protein
VATNQALELIKTRDLNTPVNTRAPMGSNILAVARGDRRRCPHGYPARNYVGLHGVFAFSSNATVTRSSLSSSPFDLLRPQTALNYAELERAER